MVVSVGASALTRARTIGQFRAPLSGGMLAAMLYVHEEYFDRVGALPPLPTKRIVAVLRAAVAALLLLSISGSTVVTSELRAMPAGRYAVVDVRQNGSRFAPLADWPIEMVLFSHGFEAHAGCNWIRGSVRLDSGRLTETGDGLYSGIMGCAVPEGMSVSADVWIMSFLRTRPVVIVDGDRLWLRGSAGSVLELVRVR